MDVNRENQDAVPVDGFRMLDDEIAAKAPKMLYHYTSASGALGIIGSGVLWATEASYLNDASELHYALDKLKASWNDEYEKLNELIPALPGIDGGLQSRSLQATFIACLCESKDLLSQWRGYASPGGYAIGFDTRKLYENYVKRSRRGILASVSYDRAVSEGTALRWATDASAHWKEAFPSGIVDHIRDLAGVGEAVAANKDSFFGDPDGFIHGVLHQEAVTEALARTFSEFQRRSFGHINTAAAFHKNPAFSEEQEWRLVTALPLNSRGMAQDMHFRETLHGLTPYIEIKFQDAPSETPISEIVIGPGADYDQRERALRMLLLSHGYPSDIKITPSTVPLRA